MSDVALHYAQAVGWPVLPLIGKRPLTPHGFKDATRSISQIRAWWDCWPEANIGVPTGQETGVVILDIDPQHGGEHSLRLIEARSGPLPQTRQASTGGGGFHFFYRHPPGRRIPNAVSFDGYQGVDVRGDGGYVVVPPSRHPATGRRYLWIDTGPCAVLPTFLTPPARPASPPIPFQRATQHSTCTRGNADFWLGQALARAAPGNRNHTGFWLACRLREQGLDLVEAESFMRRYALQVPAGDHPYTVREALASLKSAYGGK